jgi:hypothetical protein
MTSLERWKRCDNYMGEDFSDYYMVAGQNRDSNYVQQSNFIAATERLGGENEPMVIIARSTHWACGWVDFLMVHKDALDKIEIAEKIDEDIENCIILDWENYDAIRQPEIERLYHEIKVDIELGNSKYWDCWGVDETMTDDELLMLVTDHVS